MSCYCAEGARQALFTLVPLLQPAHVVQEFERHARRLWSIGTKEIVIVALPSLPQTLTQGGQVLSSKLVVVFDLASVATN
jgi:hypothetical protein